MVPFSFPFNTLQNLLNAVKNGNLSDAGGKCAQRGLEEGITHMKVFVPSTRSSCLPK